MILEIQKKSISASAFAGRLFDEIYKNDLDKCHNLIVYACHEVNERKEGLELSKVNFIKNTLFFK